MVSIFDFGPHCSNGLKHTFIHARAPQPKRLSNKRKYAIPCALRPKPTCRLLKLRPPLIPWAARENKKRPICAIWNRRQYLANDIFGMLRIHRFPGASTARGRTGPRELFLSRQYPHLHILFAHSHRAEIEGCPRRTAQEHFAVSAEIVGTPEKFDITRAGKDSVYSEAQT